MVAELFSGLHRQLGLSAAGRSLLADGTSEEVSMATVHPAINGRYAHPTRPRFEWRDYAMALAVGVIFACLAALRLGIGPLEHAALDPVANRGFLFGLIEYLASQLGNLPTVALVGIAISLLTLQVSALSNQRGSF